MANVSNLRCVMNTDQLKNIDIKIASFNTTNQTRVLSLEEIEHARFLDYHVPAFVFLLLMCIVGTIGNSLTVLTYSLSAEMHTRHVRVLIMWLATIDFLVCVVVIPVQMSDIMFSYSWSSDVGCRLFQYLMHVTTVASGLILTTVAAERYQITFDSKLTLSCCKVFSNELETRSTTFKQNVICIVIIVLCLVGVIPVWYYKGLEIVPTEFPPHTAKICTPLRRYRTYFYAVIYSGSLGFLILMCFAVATFSYGKILHLIYQQGRQEKQRNQCHISFKPICSSAETGKPKTENAATGVHEYQRRHAVNFNEHPHRCNRYAAGQQITTTLIAATTVSFLGYLIFLVMNCITKSNSRFPNSAIINVLFQSCFINNIINPVIYFIVDKKFRNACKSLKKKVSCPKGEM